MTTSETAGTETARGGVLGRHPLLFFFLIAFAGAWLVEAADHGVYDILESRGSSKRRSCSPEPVPASYRSPFPGLWRH